MADLSRAQNRRANGKKKKCGARGIKRVAENVAQASKQKNAWRAHLAWWFSVEHKSVWLRVWRASEQKMRDKALNQKHKIINLKFQWIFYFYSLNSNFQKSFNFKISKIFSKPVRNLK